MTRTALSCSAVAFLTAGCAGLMTRAPDLVEAKAEVRATTARVAAAEAARDVETALAYYASDALVHPPGAPPVVGHDAIRAMYTGFVELPFTAFESSTNDVQVAAGADLAFENGVNRFRFQGPQGPWEDVGKYLVVWRKEEAGWKIAALSFSSDDVPPGGTEARDAERHAVIEVVDRWEQLALSEDLGILSQITAHDEDMVAFGTDAAERWVGYDALEKATRAQFAASDTRDLRIRERVVQVAAAANAAWFSEIIDASFVSGGEETKVEGLRLTGVLEKRDGGWVIVQTHASVPVPGQLVAYPTD